ncbi:hypothetical protein V8G54_010010, partial [Vigna mungo]
GSVCYKHIPKEKRRKLDDRSESLILVGYHSTGAYRLFNSEKEEVIINRDVIVDEGVVYDWQKADDKPEIVFGWLEEDGLRQNVVNDEGNSRRSQRVRFPSTRLIDHEVFADNDIADSGDLVHFVFLADAKPITWRQAIDIKEWKEAMIEELKSIERNRTWDMVELPQHKRAIEVKWVFKSKYKPRGEIAKLKARLVAKGFLQ